jgi:hypothetical protein
MQQPNTIHQPAPQTTFAGFYRQVFLPEHQHPGTVALHVLGTVAGLLFVVTTWVTGLWWWALLFPLVHALPGLLGHRLWERNATVGDVRVTRRDYSPLWFIAGNHRMTWDLVVKGFYWRANKASG